MWPKFFQNQIKNKKLSHAYLILVSPFGERKEIFDNLKKIIPTNKEDLHLIEDSSIKINQIRGFKHNLSLKPFKSFYKIAVILYGEGLTLEASNSLLKTLEEPPGQALIFIFVADKEMLLPTILSRCQVLRLNVAIVNKINFLEKTPDLGEISKMNLVERFDWAKKIAESENLEKIILSWQLQAKKKILKEESFSDIINSTCKLLSLLKTNSNKTLLLERFFLQLQ